MAAMKRMEGLMRIAAQIAFLGALWFAADFASRALALPLPGSVIGLAALLALLLSGRFAPSWVKAGADWLFSHMVLFFVPATVAIVQYGGLFKSDGWRLALVVVAGTLTVMVAVALTVEHAARFERRLAVRRAASQAHSTPDAG